MANICTGQQQIPIIPTWIVRAITKIFKKAIKCLGTSTSFLCWHTVYKGLHDFWPLYEYSLKYKSHFCLNLTQIYCCAASVASEQQHKQDLRRTYKREYEFSKSSLFTRMLCGFLPECIAPFYQSAL